MQIEQTTDRPLYLIMKQQSQSSRIIDMGSNMQSCCVIYVQTQFIKKGKKSKSKRTLSPYNTWSVIHVTVYILKYLSLLSNECITQANFIPFAWRSRSQSAVISICRHSKWAGVFPWTQYIAALRPKPSTCCTTPESVKTCQ